MKNKIRLVKFSISMFLLVSVSMVTVVAIDNTPEPTVTPTESSGGIIGTGVDELRCPINLSGVGPTWNGITIGVSSPEDLSEYFGYEGVFATPYPPHAGNYAPNFEFYAKELGGAFACVVDGKVAALLIDRHAVSESIVPMGMEQWISLLGMPDLVSWHQQMNLRMFHWPEYGISISAEISGSSSPHAYTEWLYLYPFRGADYENLWPINRVWQIQPFAIESPDIELDVLDLEAIQLTVTAHAPWPTVTPYMTATP